MNEQVVELKEIKPFAKKVWLSTPTMHGEEQKYVNDAFAANWITTAGENVTELEHIAAEYIGTEYAIGLSSGTAALHMAIKLAGCDLYGVPKDGGLTLKGKRVFCSDVTFAATVNPIVYEGGEPVFIDTEYDTWNMDPEALKRAFELYPDVRLVVLVNLYGTPAKMDEIKAICDANNAILIEDAAESLGAHYKEKMTGGFGKYSIISYNGNKIITGSSGGALLTNDSEAANKVRKWSTQSRENAPWYQHKELGYNYRISNIVAGIARGQYEHLNEHIALKKDIFERYKEGLKDLPVRMNPFIEGEMEPNFWLSCMIIDREAMCQQTREETTVSFHTEIGKTCPTEILEKMAEYNIEGRPIWKPMHMQPIYRNNIFVTADREDYSEAPCKTKVNVGYDIFERGLCLPSDIKMTPEEQNIVISIIKSCFE